MIAREELGPVFAAAVACRGTFEDLPEPTTVAGPGTRELAAALEGRRSVRSYAAEPVSVDLVCAVINSGLALDRELWAAEDDLRIVLLAARISALEPGVYAYEDALTRRAPLRTLADHVFQPDLATAAAVIVVCGDLATAVKRHGPHGYRRLLTRAGAIVAACQLAASRVGLHGCPFDGLLPEGADPVRDLSLFALALGLPAATTTAAAEPDPARRSH